MGGKTCLGSLGQARGGTRGPLGMQEPTTRQEPAGKQQWEATLGSNGNAGKQHWEATTGNEQDRGGEHLNGQEPGTLLREPQATISIMKVRTPKQTLMGESKKTNEGFPRGELPRQRTCKHCLNEKRTATTRSATTKKKIIVKIKLGLIRQALIKPTKTNLCFFC